VLLRIHDNRVSQNNSIRVYISWTVCGSGEDADLSRLLIVFTSKSKTAEKYLGIGLYRVGRRD